MHDLVLCLKVCYVVALETYIIDIMYMIITYWFCCKFNRKLITAGYSSLVPQKQEHHFCPPFHVHHHGAFGHDLQQDAWLLRWVMPSNMIWGDVHTGSDITSLTPRLQNVLPPSLSPSKCLSSNAKRPLVPFDISLQFIKQIRSIFHTDAPDYFLSSSSSPTLCVLLCDVRKFIRNK